MKAQRPLVITRYESVDLDTVIDIFVAAIRGIASKDYTPEQVAAWAEVDRKGWARARGSRPTWIARVGQSAAGFTDLEPDGHLDMMFVYPAHQGTGVASALLETVMTAARAQGLARVFTEASITARPFFERRGFSILASQLVEKRGQQLRNYRMAKQI